MYRKVFAVLTTIMLAVQPCYADESQDLEMVPYLEEIVVTAKPIVEGTTITRYGEKVSTVSSHQVDDLNAQDLPTALRRVPGLTISRYNMIGGYGGGEGGAVFVRSHGSSRPGAEISMLVDGIPRFVGVWTHPLMDIMSIDYADQIDIHKSARPVLLGNMSYASVNVRPKRITASGFNNHITSAGGSHGTLIGQLEHGGKVGGFDYYFTGSQRQSDGHRNNSDGKVRSVYGRVGYQWNDQWDATMQITHSDGAVSDPGVEVAVPIPLVERFDTDNELYIGTLSHRHGNINGSAKLYYENGTNDWRQWDDDSGERFNSVTDYDNFGIRLREVFMVSEGTEILAGIDHDVYGGEFREQRVSGDTGYKKIFFSNTAPYFMISRKFGDRTTVIPSFGVRYNMSRYFDNQVGAQAGLTLERNGIQVYVNASRAFNLPGVYAAVQYDTFWSFNGANTGQWKELKPEQLDHYEIGLSRAFADNLTGELSYYYENVTDALRFIAPPPPPPIYMNAGAYIARGVEASLSYEPLRNLDLFGGISLMNTTPDDVPNAPESSVSAGAGYTAFSKLRISVDIQHVGRQYVLNPRFAATQQQVEDYMLFNSRIGWFVAFDERIGELFCAVENIMNESYEYRPGYPMPGRTFMIGLDVRL